MKPTTHFSISRLFIALFSSSLLFVVLVAAKSPATNANALRKLVEDVSQRGKLSWKLAYNYDPYAEGVVMRTSPNRPCTLRMTAEGRYERITDQQKQVGRWEIDRENNLLTFICEEVNGKALVDQASVHYLEVSSYSQGVMILTWQGRHGAVEEVYQPVVKIERGAVAIPGFSLR